MRIALVLSAAAAALAAAGLALVLTQTDWLRFGGDEEAGALTPEARRAALLGDLRTVGYGEEREGASVREEAGGGAVFLMPGGREVRVDAPPRHRLTGEFVLLSALAGGFFLAPAAEPGGAEPADPGDLYVSFVDARRPLEPGTSGEGLALYGDAAARIEEAGSLPFLDGTLEVLSVVSGQDAVLYCLRRDDGMLFDGGTRFVGTLAVTVMAVGDCPEDRTRIAARLDTAEAALAGNR